MADFAFSIGDVVLKHGLMLAPLAGVSDHPFRRVCRGLGAEYTVSEMVSAKSLCYEKKSKKALAGQSKTAPLAQVHADDIPMAVQLFGSEPEFMAEAAAMIADGSYAGCRSAAKPTAIDINMGCPVHKIVSNGEGSALLRNIPLAGRIVRAVAASQPLPVTVKIRIGFDADSICAVEMARELEAAGASAICVHGRTREQMYRPGVCLEQIAAVKNIVRIPVIGNGDIYTAADALHMKRETGCDGLMIARGAMGNPWLFSEIIAAMEGREFTPPTMEERIETALSQMRQMIEEKGERAGFAESKKQMAWYIHGVKGAAEARGRMMTAQNADEVAQILRVLI
ncbi:MAG: tRNA dihydrouridine synthase DusB [Clostridia bacterium]|nr:tRNA dihydrouridine synthase DusB [Clostridia bacterium]